MNRALPLLVLALAPSARAAAQAERPWGQAVAHYVKWTTAAGAVAFTVFAAQEHRRSARQWDRLLALCRADNAECVTGRDGRYTNPTAEQLYQQARWYDRRANRRLLGAQLSVLATAALFILDARHRPERPENIPLHRARLAVAPTGDGAQVEMRIPF